MEMSFSLSFSLKWSGNATHLSATDLVGHLSCRHLTNLDQAIVKGVLAKLVSFDPFLEILNNFEAAKRRLLVAPATDQ